MFALSGLLTEVLDFSIAPLNCIFMRPFDPPTQRSLGVRANRLGVITLKEPIKLAQSK